MNKRDRVVQWLDQVDKKLGKHTYLYEGSERPDKVMPIEDLLRQCCLDEFLTTLPK